MTEEKVPYGDSIPESHELFIRDEGPHDFYSQIPNLVDEMNLSPFAYRLYGHFRRVAGEKGKCWQSTTTLAKSCRMSSGKVSDAKQELAETYPPLIRIEKRQADGKMYDEVSLTDIWQLNHKHFTGETVHHMNGHNVRSPHERDRSPHERKNNPIKNNTGERKEKRKTTKKGDGVDAMLLTPEAQAEMIRITDILHTFERDLKRSDDLAGNETWRSFAKNFVIPQMDKGHDYQVYLDWYCSDPRRMEWAWNEDTTTIKRRWLMAWADQPVLPGIEVVPASEVPATTPAPAYVPNPRLKQKNLAAFQRLESQG